MNMNTNCRGGSIKVNKNGVDHNLIGFFVCERKGLIRKCLKKVY